jgi:uncharacterized protein YuzE
VALAGSYYDRAAGIAFIQIRQAAVATTEDADWGLVDYDGEGKVVGVEIRRASDVLPATLLGLMPSPEGLMGNSASF